LILQADDQIFSFIGHRHQNLLELLEEYGYSTAWITLHT